MKKRIFAWALACLLMLSVLCGCGSAGGSGSGSGAKDTALPSGDMESAASADMGGYGDYENAVTSAPMAPQEEPETPAEGQSDPLRDAKLIYTGNLEMETTAFDGVLESLQSLVTACGGYVESSSLSNRGSGYRYANYTVRVPAAQYSRFFSQAGELCHVTWKNEDVQNVSTYYYDTAGRLKTQQTKLERLQDLLSRAESMEDIITIESAISETEQTIESLSGELRHYDALVDYSTVYISLDEVYKLSNTDEPATGFFSRIGAAFSSGWKGFLNALESLAVAAAYGWIWLVLLAVAAVAVVRRLRKKRAGTYKPEPKEPDDKLP